MDKEAKKARIRLPVEVKIRKLTLDSGWQIQILGDKHTLWDGFIHLCKSVVSLLTFSLYSLFFSCKIKGCFCPQY